MVFVFPALTIYNYMAQGALILRSPKAVENPFFLLTPGWAQVPIVFLATFATVIASQAVITGAFSVAHQAARIGYLPRLRVVYTSEETMGQIYVPWINWLLLVAVLTLVVTFKSSAALAYAFGMAVTGTITITTLLFFYVVRYQWHRTMVDRRARRRLPPDRGPLGLRRQPDQTGERGVASAADRHHRVHRPDHLAERPGTGHPPAANATRGSSGRSSITSMP